MVGHRLIECWVFLHSLGRMSLESLALGCPGSGNILFHRRMIFLFFFNNDQFTSMVNFVMNFSIYMIFFIYAKLVLSIHVKLIKLVLSIHVKLIKFVLSIHVKLIKLVLSIHVKLIKLVLSIHVKLIKFV